MEAQYDENTVTLGDKKQFELALQIRDKIDELKRSEIPNHTNSNLDELKKLKELLDLEIITQEEFNVQKEKLLS